tara:strand:+ start:1830 stop:3656 length:1827 start_codon:yes stop_codon:yes gene_type:complete
MIKRLLFICFFSFLIMGTSFVFADYDIKSLGKLPVLYNGRLQPFESFARQMLISIREKSTIKRVTEGKSETISASLWLWEVLTHSKQSKHDLIFLIHDIDIRHEFKLDDSQKHFSYADLMPFILDIQSKAMAVSQKEKLSVYEQNMQQLAGKLSLFISLLHSFIPYEDLVFYDYVTAYHQRVTYGLSLFNAYNKTGSLASKKDQLHLLEFNQDFKRHRQFSDASQLYLYPAQKNLEDLSLWSNTGSELLKHLDFNHISNPVLLDYAHLTLHYNNDSYKLFNQTVTNLLDYFKDSLPTYFNTIILEYYFTVLNPFYICMVLYVCVLCLMLLFYLFNHILLYRFAAYLCFISFAIHSLSLLARMLILDRPPVINLYSSAVFVGWVAIALCLLQERLFRNKLGYFMSAVLGFITLIIAHHLALQSDTMEQMQAVLDSNFWLSTHVITITLGYGGTFLAGMIATCYVFINIIKKAVHSQNLQLYKMVYAVICFSLFFSFIGTVLGGIWADQSWGRFWGWDPKENGALLIVIFNAIILHARLAGMVSIRGVMLLAILGNIVTAFSWFGVNMLGVGLHSYGFMNEAFQWLMLYIASQLLIVVLGFNFISVNSKN